MIVARAAEIINVRIMEIGLYFINDYVKIFII